DRELVEKIFGFTYSWEVYLPVEKRKYGYYVLPVLYGDQLVARFEPEVYRGKNPLQIKNWWWEEGVKVTPEMKAAVNEGLQKFCQYLQADGYDWPAEF
ncbi:MAG TPA: crosslink repair DNA glycosylase YcaQ family protein, partial [Bacillota bacterium]|nr:crosslink repair DNA glycosylase YcaQ family protein [Bacillota bacterium]